MKNNALFSTLLLSIALMVLAGCDPTLNTEGGRNVKFTATTQASPATKTAYRDTSGGWQTISWEAGDKIRIYAPNNGSISGKPVDASFGLNYVYADYQVTRVDNQGHLSKASLNNDAANGLAWTGAAGDAVFYAAYPGDVVKIATNTSSDESRKLRFYFEIPNSQSGKPEFVGKLPMLSRQKVANGQDVHLDFYPAFSAFEFNLKSDIDDSFTVDWVELSTDPTVRSFPLTGACYYDLNLLDNSATVTDPDYPHFVKLSTADITSSAVDTSIKFNLGATISKTQAASFTFFTLPLDLSGLVFRVHSKKTNNGGTEESTKTLKLKRSDNTWVSFPAGHKAMITGVAVNPDLWCFSTITLNGEVLTWETDSVTTTSRVNVEASQFAITGVRNMYQIHGSENDYKPYRQRWIIPSANDTAKVSFKIVSPESGTYTVTPMGDSDDFTIQTMDETPVAFTHDSPLTGNISSTNIRFMVIPKTETVGTNSKVWFITTVKASDGTVFNIDSETQLYDLRGYHYFMTQEQTGTF